jgi:hypothetical protein
VVKIVTNSTVFQLDDLKTGTDILRKQTASKWLFFCFLLRFWHFSCFWAEPSTYAYRHIGREQYNGRVIWWFGSYNCSCKQADSPNLAFGLAAWQKSHNEPKKVSQGQQRKRNGDSHPVPCAIFSLYRE